MANFEITLEAKFHGTGIIADYNISDLSTTTINTVAGRFDGVSICKTNIVKRDGIRAEELGIALEVIGNVNNMRSIGNSLVELGTHTAGTESVYTDILQFGHVKADLTASFKFYFDRNVCDQFVMPTYKDLMSAIINVLNRYDFTSDAISIDLKPASAHSKTVLVAFKVNGTAPNVKKVLRDLANLGL